MKTLISISLLFITVCLLQSHISPRQVKGIVLDADNIPIIGANIYIKDSTIGTLTDIDGRFEIGVPDDRSTLVISYTGYKSEEILIGDKVDLTIILENKSGLLDEVVIKEYRKETLSGTLTGTHSVSSSVSAPSGMTLAIAKSDVTSPSAVLKSFTESVSVELPYPGQMTAGEWNDLNNWEDWNTLINKKDYKSMSRHWNIYPNERYSVFVTNKQNYPVINAKVELLSKNNRVIWTTMTDNTGKAELWNSLDSEKQPVKKIRISKDHQVKFINKPVAIDHGSNHLSIDIQCADNRSVDVAFIVDATGSMGDEIDFLRSELTDIISRLEAHNQKTSYRTASVFYKDHKEDYLTLTTELSEDVTKTTEFINTKSAGGGGDYEEAVEEGIKEALALDWNPNAVARIAFLVLDAPPHHTPVIIETLRSQVTTAAAQGIKLIPITASGINRETEFLMKYLSIITNGTYVFITDDSGIGHGHLDPIVEDFEVEKLNDLIVRLIESYGHVESCENDKVISEIDIKVFPNPASEFVNVKINQNADRITLRSSSGKIVMQINAPKKGTNKIMLDNLVGGMYTVHVEKDKEILVSKSIIVIN